MHPSTDCFKLFGLFFPFELYRSFYMVCGIVGDCVFETNSNDCVFKTNFNVKKWQVLMIKQKKIFTEKYYLENSKPVAKYRTVGSLKYGKQ